MGHTCALLQLFINSFIQYYIYIFLSTWGVISLFQVCRKRQASISSKVAKNCPKKINNNNNNNVNNTKGKLNVNNQEYSHMYRQIDLQETLREGTKLYVEGF